MISKYGLNNSIEQFKVYMDINRLMSIVSNMLFLSLNKQVV
jgi:hypothetical protein